MPRKKNVPAAPEEPLTEDQEVQALPTESDTMEGDSFPLEAGAVDLSPESGDALAEDALLTE